MLKEITIKCDDPDVLKAVVEHFEDTNRLDEEFLGDRIYETAHTTIERTDIHKEEDFAIIYLIV